MTFEKLTAAHWPLVKEIYEMPVSGRCVYAGVGEVSVYVTPDAQGKGVGKALLDELIRLSEMEEFWTLTAGIFPENLGSLKIHERVGFKVLGTAKR